MHPILYIYIYFLLFSLHIFCNRISISIHYKYFLSCYLNLLFYHSHLVQSQRSESLHLCQCFIVTCLLSCQLCTIRFYVYFFSLYIITRIKPVHSYGIPQQFLLRMVISAVFRDNYVPPASCRVGVVCGQVVWLAGKPDPARCRGHTRQTRASDTRCFQWRQSPRLPRT